MSIYNHGSSIPISSLTETQLKMAMTEWAEGNPHMERLLWNCYHHGVKTSGCCAHRPYIGVRIEGSSLENLKKVINVAETYGNTSLVLFLSAANPCSGPNWYREDITISPLKGVDRNDFLDELANALEKENDDSTENGFVHVIEFFYFLKEKDSDIIVRMTVEDTFRYTLELDYAKCRRNVDYYSVLFPKAGLIDSVYYPPDCPYAAWQLECTSASEFDKAIKKCLNLLKSNWKLKVRDEITSDMSFSAKAQLMRRKFGTTPEGIQMLNDWINANRHPSLPMVNYS
ncbi:MAG: hypothetical protein IJ215_01445 [Clostridia bacterium]|nr:hypothetical protein [Clostridia bacterium]